MSGKLPRALILLAILAAIAATFIGGTIYGLGADPNSEIPAGTLIRVREHLRRLVGHDKEWAVINADVASNIERPCPQDAIVIATAGQSNAANAISTPLDANTTLPVYMFFKGRCYALRDPLLGSNGTSGSVWSRFAPMLVARTGRPVVIISGAIGGSQFGDWTDPHSPYMPQLRKRVIEAAKIVGAPDVVLWHQGETDAWFKPSQAQLQPTIEKALHTLLTTFPLKPAAKLILYRASICTGAKRQASTPSVIAAETAAAASDPRIIAGPNTDVFGDRFRHDNCHFNEEGARRVAQLTLDVVTPLVSKP
jgi:hypothetical protein